jgi:Spy/CpxP family protein refolding chaperone
MITNKHLSILPTSMLGVLLAFGCAASAQTTNSAPGAAPLAAVQNMNPAPSVAATPASVRARSHFGPLAMMKQSLNLTDEQVQKLEPVMKDQQAKVAALRKDTTLSRQDRVAKLKQVGESASAKLKAVLTPEQLAKWQSMRTNYQSKVQQRLRQPPPQQQGAPAAPAGARPAQGPAASE